jgi:hypothetical protein
MGVKTVFAGLYELNYDLRDLLNTLTLRAIPGLNQALVDFGKPDWRRRGSHGDGPHVGN